MLYMIKKLKKQPRSNKRTVEPHIYYSARTLHLKKNLENRSGQENTPKRCICSYTEAMERSPMDGGDDST